VIDRLILEFPQCCLRYVRRGAWRRQLIGQHAPLDKVVTGPAETFEALEVRQVQTHRIWQLAVEYSR
jgi:hypothetical protein